MPWTLSVGPCEQGDVSAVLEVARDEQREERNYTDAELAQQNAAIAAAEELALRAEFHGGKVTAELTGHVRTNGSTVELDAVSVLLTGEPAR
jgi:hypothetical protein